MVFPVVVVDRLHVRTGGVGGGRQEGGGEGV